MPTAPSSSPNAIDDDVRYTAEVRFGVVMYGGVSLAVYINGVTRELYEMACATPRRPLPAPAPKSSREIYDRLSWLNANPGLRADYAARLAHRTDPAADPWGAVSLAGAERSRLVVDVVSGTSAGGINGVFLAKALANGEEFRSLEDLWLDEGDIGRLLNDAESYADLGDRAPDRSARPRSLLNSDRMYLKLLDALQQMRPMPGVARGGESPLVEQMDLFVTTTDIAGAPVALRLFDKVVYERRYKQSFHFQYPNGTTVATDPVPGGNDFRPEHAPFLAFAARCTSSFPFAFEPMTLAAVARLHTGIDAAGLRAWDPYFASLPQAEVRAGAHVWRAFGDGGYLDNKPFSYVVGALSQRFSSVPVERKVVYVEPSPERIDPHDLPTEGGAPDAIGNAMAALTSIPRYEGIREDLQDMLARNRRIERVERIVRLGEIDLEADADPFRNVLEHDGSIPAWTSLSLKDMARYYGLAFLPYRRLRLYAVTDRLADRLGARWGIDPRSDHQYALRALVRVWREREFDDDGSAAKQSVNAFLDQFDIDYRMRRLGFLLRKVDQVTRLFRERRRQPQEATGAAKPLSETSDWLLTMLVRHFDGADPTQDARAHDLAIGALRALKVGLLEARRAVEAVQRAQADALRAPPPDPLVGQQLRDVLALLIDESPPAAPQDPAPATAGSARAAPERRRTTVELDLVGGGKAPVVLGTQWLRASSASQTLQESVVWRARALLEAADGAGPTVLATTLIAGIDAMRFKPAAGQALPVTLAAGSLMWELLGTPALVRRDVVVDGATGSRIVVEVGPTTIALGGDAGARELLDADVGRRLRTLVAEYALRFDSFDQMSFPLYYDTGTGEPATCEVVRISPVDATHLIDEATDPRHRRKLAGTALANFGAFLDARWRRNDAMWGRLDGAERLITALLPASDTDTLACRVELIELAQRRILGEALTRQGRLELTDLLCRALAEVDGASVETRLRALLKELSLGTRTERDKLEGVLVSLLGDAGLMDFVRTTRENDPDPEPKALLRNASRAVTVTGRLLDGISRGRDIPGALPRWVARAGLLLQGIVAVSLPGTFNQRWFAYAVNLLYAFEIVALVVAMVFGGSGARTLAVTALLVTITVHFLSLVAGDLMREKAHWRRIGVAAALLAAVLLASIGAIGLWNVGLAGQLCGAPTADAEPGWFCGRFGAPGR